MIGTMPRHGFIPGAVFAALAAGVMLALAGCAGSQGEAPGPSLDGAITPVVRGAEAGLEVRLWVVENRSGVLSGALRDFSPPATAGAGETELWHENGFRVLEVPIERLDELRAGLPTIGPLHREWLGLLPEWVEVVKGAMLVGGQPARMDTGAAMLGPGRLRLVTRCWATPSVGALPEGAGAGALLHVEVMPELVTPRRGDDDDLTRLLEGGLAPRSGVRGLALERLRLGVVSSGAGAIVIVPEDPDVDWHAEATGRPESGLEARGQRATIGPRMMTTPTLGELMLTSLALPESAGDARVVVVLVPRVPERFELLPR